LNVGVRAVARQQLRHLYVVVQRHIHNVNRQNFGLARIKASLVHMQVGKIWGRNAQLLGRQLRQRIYRVGQGLAVGVGFGRGIGSAAVFHRQGRQGEFEF
jgi:hypothetical protein